MSKGIEEVVRERYAAVAASMLTNESKGVQAVAEAFGYSAEELQSIPAEANMGLSCGNPLATAHLRPGEVVVDLGSGGGIDVLLAARKVGPSGKAIGIDMTDEMLDRARKNADKAGATNAEFHKATIDSLPLDDASADCIISNCVINLASDKRAVFREMARVLKPGGRVAVSDIALKKPLPPEIGQDLLAYVGCIAGAIPIKEYRDGLKEAGFAHVEIKSRAQLAHLPTGHSRRHHGAQEMKTGVHAHVPVAAPPIEARRHGLAHRVQGVLGGSEEIVQRRDAVPGKRRRT